MSINDRTDMDDDGDCDGNNNDDDDDDDDNEGEEGNEDNETDITMIQNRMHILPQISGHNNSVNGSARFVPIHRSQVVSNN
jgi:hypothetical protein